MKIRVDDKWYEYPDKQIKSWDSDGNIEYYNIHVKFIKWRPQKGDEFIPSDNNNFNFINNIFYNKNIILDNILKLEKDCYKDKKIALIGSGVYDYNLTDLNKYDIIVGINQIYKTTMFDKIDVIYHGLSINDLEFIDFFPNTNKKVIFIPRIKVNNGRFSKLLNEFINNKYNFYWESDILINIENIIKTNPLSGIVALNHIISQDPILVDIYGFNFYTKPYVEGMVVYNNASKSHNIELNKKHFEDILVKNKKVNWIK